MRAEGTGTGQRGVFNLGNNGMAEFTGSQQTPSSTGESSELRVCCVTTRRMSHGSGITAERFVKASKP